MADDSSAQKVDPSLVAEIVSSYVAQNSIGVDQLAGLIATVHRTLSGLGDERAGARGRSVDAGGADPAIGAARPCRVPRMRVSRPDAAPASARRAWARTGGISRPLEVVSRSPDHRAALFGAAFDDGKAARPRKTAASRRVDAGSRSGRPDPRSGVAANRDRQPPSSSALGRPNERREPLWLRALPCCVYM